MQIVSFCGLFGWNRPLAKRGCRSLGISETYPGGALGGWRVLLGEVINGCGSKPTVPFWGRCTTHFRTYVSGDWDVHWGYDLGFDPWPIYILTANCAFLEGHCCNLPSHDFE